MDDSLRNSVKFENENTVNSLLTSKPLIEPKKLNVTLIKKMNVASHQYLYGLSFS